MAIENKYQSYNSNHERPIFEAVRQGAHEVVKVIIPSSEAALNYINEEGHNVIQFAITNRSEKVYNYLYPRIEGRYSYIRMTDSSTNNLLHLAGRLAPPFVISRTRGAALQLQRELQWREEVYKLLLPTYRSKKNAVDETPAMVFTREHADLLKEGERWIKTTAESCSITAALIVTIVFAAAITVPGGSNQDTGIPLFKRNIAFIIFAALDAVSLFSAATALLVFLSILTTRYAEKDFLVILPRRLIIGLLALFISATSMMIAFGAILFLVFCDQRPWMLAPIGVLTCVPIGVNGPQNLGDSPGYNGIQWDTMLVKQKDGKSFLPTLLLYLAATVMPLELYASQIAAHVM
ncbi:ankyrin repeat-containing protein, partial [Tanacetum coccineum]